MFASISLQKEIGGAAIVSALECISAWLFILLTGGVPVNIFWLRRPPPLLVLCYIAAVSKIQ